MWRRTYLLLALVRLFLALSPSYLHPDEHFQGPEVIAGRIFGYKTYETWEFSTDAPIRSVLPLWVVYGLPLRVLKLCWAGQSPVNPAAAFAAMRATMFVLSFVLEDWAVHELIGTPHDRTVAVLLVASSYVTWTWQTHTFTNAIETLAVLWSLVMVNRLRRATDARAGRLSSMLLALFLVGGTFTRITFPAFVFVPALLTIPSFLRRPLNAVVFTATAIIAAGLAVLVDTEFYSSARMQPVVTPLNNLLYNSKAVNLAQHGSHPLYQHVAVNLPQLLGPAFLLLFNVGAIGLPLVAALGGVAVLSAFPHQEARFLLPAVPLCLSSVRLPKTHQKIWVWSWIWFNAALGILMGIYHQAGVVPAQIYLGRQVNVSRALWWKTYSPPRWLLGGQPVQTVDLMGMKADLLEAELCGAPEGLTSGPTVLVAPRSAAFLDHFVDVNAGTLCLTQRWSDRWHINLDDMDFGEDGVGPTLARVFGRNGIAIWDVECRAT